MGGFMIAEVARLLKENKVKLPFGLYVTNSVQEEVGLRGAEMIVERIKPDLAIVTDVTHDTQTPMMNKIQSGDIACGAGPVLSYGPAVHNTLLKHIVTHRREGEDRLPTRSGQPCHRHRYRCLRVRCRRCAQRPDQPAFALHAHHRGERAPRRRGERDPA